MIQQDHTGRAFPLNHVPERIICLVPSITELLHDLGLADKIVGRTKFCIYPENGFPSAKIIGGTKNIHVDIIKDLNPDLVIANKEENIQEQVLALSEFTSVFTTIVRNTEEALKMILDIGSITGTAIKAETMVSQLKTSIFSNKQTSKISMAYLIWRKPYMTIGGDTYISAFMEDFGFINCYKDQMRYPEVTIEDLVIKKPKIILLSSEPFPFDENHAFEISRLTGIKTMLIDGSICSWYGSRMLKAKDFLETYMQQFHDEMSLNKE